VLSLSRKRPADTAVKVNRVGATGFDQRPHGPDLRSSQLSYARSSAKNKDTPKMSMETGRRSRTLARVEDRQTRYALAHPGSWETLFGISSVAGVISVMDPGCGRLLD